MKLGFLDESKVGEGLQIVLADPYDNALMIADLTALKSGSRFVYAQNETGIKGLLSMYTGLSFPAIAIWCEDASLFREMLRRMASRYPQLKDGSVWCLSGKKSLGLLEKTVHIDLAREELQMKLDLAGYKPGPRTGGPERVVALTADSLADLDALYRVVPPEVWRPEEISRGPYRGVYEGGKLVAAAGVHWVSPWIAELGNVAVHPDFRRRGLAEACVRAVIEELKKLTERVYLMVFADNEPGIKLYRKMGFEEVQRMWLVSFRLPGRWHLPRRKSSRASRLTPQASVD